MTTRNPATAEIDNRRDLLLALIARAIVYLIKNEYPTLAENILKAAKELQDTHWQ